MFKLGRNDECLCGSKKKYKKCCLGRPDNPEFENPSKIKGNIKKVFKARIVKQCIHLNKEECSSKIIKAHSIQNNRILSKLSVEGLVNVMDVDEGSLIVGIQQKGRKVATTFTGFCGYHDNMIFQPIEDEPFIKSNEQLYLFAYRAFAIGYHKKIEQIKMTQVLFREKPSVLEDERFKIYLSGCRQSNKELDIVNKKFNEALASQNYDLLNHYVWELDYEVEFALSTLFEPEETIRGIKINDFTDFSKPLKSLFVSIVPLDGKTYFIFSYLAENHLVYSRYFKEFDSLTTDLKKKYINNMIAIHTEHIVSSPRLIEKWSKEELDAFHSLFHMSIMMRNKGEYMLEEPYFDFFKQ